MILAVFNHQIDPIILGIGGLYLWWYGASYTLGFISAYSWIRRAGPSIGIGRAEALNLSIYLAVGVLLGGRVVEVLFYEWEYYGANPLHIPALWMGGMSTHGILLGATIAVFLFCRRNGKGFLEVADLLAIAGAWIMGVGRIGNFIDGQIAGSLTDAWWGVKFPDLDGYRHPVVLYDGVKNILLVPLLLWLRRLNPPRGVVFAHFVLWYGFLRIFVDFFREYRSDFLGLPAGQEFNVLMTVVGVVMLVVFTRRAPRPEMSREPLSPPPAGNVRGLQGFVFGVLLLVPLVIPSDWTQDVPRRYGARHEGLEHSWLYPVLPPE